MRHLKIVVTMVAVLVGSLTVQGRGGGTDARVDSLLSGGNFRFVAQSAHTTLDGYNTVQLSSYYAVEFRGSGALFALPYFGQRYNGGKPTTDSPLDFSTDIAGLVCQGNTADKKGLTWKFKVRNPDQAVTFDATLRVFDNANASLTITAPSYTKIDFNGYVAPLEKDERQ